MAFDRRVEPKSRNYLAGIFLGNSMSSFPKNLIKKLLLIATEGKMVYFGKRSVLTVFDALRVSPGCFNQCIDLVRDPF